MGFSASPVAPRKKSRRDHVLDEVLRLRERYEGDRDHSRLANDLRTSKHASRIEDVDALAEAIWAVLFPAVQPQAPKKEPPPDLPTEDEPSYRES